MFAHRQLCQRRGSRDSQPSRGGPRAGMPCRHLHGCAWRGSALLSSRGELAQPLLEHYATKASTCLVVGLIMLELLVWRFEPIAYCRDWVRNTFDWIILLASLAGELYELHEESLPEEEGTSAALRIALFLRLLKVARVGHVFIELSAIFCDADDHESE